MMYTCKSSIDKCLAACNAPSEADILWRCTIKDIAFKVKLGK